MDGPPFLGVPNISEGRRPDVLRACARAMTAAGVRLLDASRDAVHHRAVFTVAGTAEVIQAAMLALFAEAVAAIDLRTHKGVHPRIGVVDVVPIVPIGPTPMAACIDLARSLGAAVADRFSVPVFLYEDAALHPSRRRLEDVRRGQFEGLAAKMRDPAWAPDFGPAEPHPTAGASAVGARRPLVAFNVNLATDRVDVARRVARAVRERTGGLPSVKALGVELPDRGCVQVTMNLTNVEQTSLATAFERVRDEAARLGVAVRGSEIIGLVPASALPQGGVASLQLEAFTPERVLEHRLNGADFDPALLT
jgi:glutamate formiminotransferase